MGEATLVEQKDAFLRYSLLNVKKHIKEQCQYAIDVREEELQQAGDNAGEVMKLSYLGYRMGIEDVYYGLFGENLPGPEFHSTIDWDNLDV
jgi:hypothetical protein